MDNVSNFAQRGVPPSLEEMLRRQQLLMLGGRPMSEAEPALPTTDPGLQQGVSKIPIEQQGVGDDMSVTANRGSSTLEYDNPVYSLVQPENREVPIEQAPYDQSPYPRTRVSPQEVARSKLLEGLPEHKGLFGMKGGFRNIVGTIGDALLLAGGRDPIYRAQREKEKMSDAMFGFGQGDPVHDKAVVARVMEQDPAAGAKLLQYLEETSIKNQAAEIAKYKARNDYNESERKGFGDGAKIYANALRGMNQAGTYNPTLLARIQKAYGLPEEFTPPPEFNSQWAEPFIRAGTPVTQQENMYLNQDKFGEQKRRNRATEEISRISATRPRAGSRPANPTDASIAAPIIQKLQRVGLEGLTKNDQDVLRAVGRHPTQKKGGKSLPGVSSSGRVIPNPPPGVRIVPKN